MSEAVARALGASASTEPIKINGKSCEIRPVVVKYLTEIGRECLRQFRRSYLENYRDNLDLLGKTQADLENKVDEVGRWDLANLPHKDAHDPKHLKITERLSEWLNTRILDEPTKDEKRLRQITASALDNGMLTDAEYLELTGDILRKNKINYVSWWITATIEGMIEMVHASFRDQGITKDDVYAELGNNFAKLAELSREIESVTTPKINEGNEPSPERTP